MRIWVLAAAIAAQSGAGPAAAQDAAPAPGVPAAPAARTPLLKDLAECRRLAADPDRLACFDRTAARLDIAEQRGDVLVADRAELRENRRTLFGLPLPELSLFNRRKGVNEPPIERVETTLRSARQAGYKWTFTLADGALWRQTDNRTLIDPQAGEPVVVRRAAMGSYLLKVGSESAVRVERVR